MMHSLFGKLNYKERSQQWSGYVPLARFVTVGIRPSEEPFSEQEAEVIIADMNRAIENMKNSLREQYGDAAQIAFEKIDRESEEVARKAEEEPETPPDPAEEERERRRAERTQRLARKLAKGLFPVRIQTNFGAAPTPVQEAAFQFLVDNEQMVFDHVTAGVWASFEEAFGQETWRLLGGLRPAKSVEELTGRFAIPRVEITRELQNGTALLVFPIECEWQDDDGLFVIFSPESRNASWVTGRELRRFTGSDPNDGEIPTGQDDSFQALLNHNEALAIKRLASGGDINEMGWGEYPPLWIAVDQMDVEEVRRLLESGADPTLTNPDEKTTPLQHAKKLYKEMGFAPSRRRDPLMDSILSMAREVGGHQFEEMKHALEEIMAVLKAAKKE